MVFSSRYALCMIWMIRTLQDATVRMSKMPKVIFDIDETTMEKVKRDMETKGIGTKSEYMRYCVRSMLHLIEVEA